MAHLSLIDSPPPTCSCGVVAGHLREGLVEGAAKVHLREEPVAQEDIEVLPKP